MTPLLAAAQKGHSHVVSLLLEAGADPNYAHPESGISALYLASQDGQTAVVQSLLAAGAQQNAIAGDSNATPIAIAASMGHLVVVKLLVDAGADIYGLPDADAESGGCSSALLIAVDRRDNEMVNFLVRSSAETGAARGETALVHSVKAKRLQAVRWGCTGSPGKNI